MSETAALKSQLTEILNHLKTTENNFSVISDKLSNFGVNFETFQKKTNEKFIKVEEKLEEKASINTCDQLSKRLDDMESKLNFCRIRLTETL